MVPISAAMAQHHDHISFGSAQVGQGIFEERIVAFLDSLNPQESRLTKQTRARELEEVPLLVIGGIEIIDFHTGVTGLHSVGEDAQCTVGKKRFRAREKNHGGLANAVPGHDR